MSVKFLYRGLFVAALLGLTACSSDVQVETAPRTFACGDWQPQAVQAGQREYRAQCAECHGGDGRQPQPGSRLLNPAEQFDYQTLLNTIDDRMPVASPARCTGNCAEQVAAYILDSWCSDEPASSAASRSASSSSAASTANLAINGDLEQGTTAGWRSVGGAEVIEATEVDARGGFYSLLTTQREDPDHGPAQVLSGLTADREYDITLYTKLYGVSEPLAAAADDVVLRLRHRYSDATADEHLTLASGDAGDSDWLRLSGRYRHPAEDTLEAVTIAVQGPPAGINLLVDDLRVVPVEQASEDGIAAGKVAYENTTHGCLFCHGNGPNEGSDPFDPFDLQYTTRQNLADYIAETMPTTAPQLCDQACGEATAAYILSWD